MPPTNNLQDDNYNSTFTNIFNDYSSIVFNNGFILGFVTGSVLTSYIFITFKRS
jgi:hypothetical protein